MRQSSIRASQFLALILASAAAAAEPAATNEERLKAAGIEPTVAGVEKYLGSLIDGEAGKETDALIDDLGHQSFAVRQKAGERLLALGTLAIDRLEKATASSDPERAWRAKAILRRVQSTGESPVLVALRLVEEKKLAVGATLLLKLCERTESPQVREAAANAAIAVLDKPDREIVEPLLRHRELAMRNIGRRLIARLDGGDEKPLLEGVFEAITIRPGVVSGGGPNLIDGWEFQARADLVVTHLGLYDSGADGLGVAHSVAIWSIDEPATPLSLATIAAGETSPLAGAFRLEPVERITLKAGRRYAIVALYPDVSDATVSLINPDGLTVEVAPHVEVLGRRYSFPHADMAFPIHLSEGAKHGTYGPTFRYEAAPELKAEPQEQK
jgi:hypothetical protein